MNYTEPVYFILFFFEPVYFKSNLRCVVSQKEEGEEQEYLRVIKGKWEG